MFEMMLRLEMVTKKTKFLEVYACQWLGPSIIGKLYEKWCYVTLYKGASMDPSWMHAKRNYQKKKKKKKKKIDVLLLFSNSAASQRCRKCGNSNFLFVKMQQPLKLLDYSNSGVQYRNLTTCQQAPQLEHTVLLSPCWDSSKSTFSVCWDGAF